MKFLTQRRRARRDSQSFFDFEIYHSIRESDIPNSNSTIQILINSVHVTTKNLQTIKNSLRPSAPLRLIKPPARSASLRLIEPAIDTDDVEEAWTVAALAGRFVELTGGADSAGLTAAAGLIAQTQQAGDAAAWIGGRGASFYPPDFAAAGIDLDALPVVRVPNALKGARAADALLRSGGFALLVLDLDADADLPLGVQSRLTGLAKKHGTALVCLARRRLEQPRRGSLVAVRVETAVQRVEFDRFVCSLRAVKDKRRAAGWDHVEVCRGPDGLC